MIDKFAEILKKIFHSIGLYFKYWLKRKINSLSFYRKGKMNSTITYCDKCFSKLRLFGFPAVSTFEMACEYYALHHEPMIICDEESSRSFMQILQLLERKGYVTTTEVALSEIAVHVRGIYNNYDDFYVCVDNKSHDCE